MKRRCVKKCTMHDSMPWSDESWYYDDDFYSDGYYEDMPAFLSKVGSAIASKAKNAKNAVMGGIQKAGNRIEKASNKVEGAIGRGASKVKGLFSRKPKTLAERGKDMLNSAKKTISKEANAIKKTVSKKAKAAGNWVKKNPVKAAAAAGAGIGAGVAAHQAVSGMTGRDSMFGITSYDSLPWVNGRRRDSALKRYIDKRVRQIISRLNDLEPGEFDPSIPLYNNRLPQARNMGAYNGPRELEPQFSKKQNEPMSGSLKSQIIQGIGETSALISRNLAKFIEPKDSQALMNEIANLKKYLLSPDTPDKRMANNIIAKLRVYLVELKKRFWEESPSWNGRFNPQLAIEWKQQVNAVLKKVDKLQDLLTSIGLR